MEVDRSLAMSTRVFRTTCFQSGVFSFTRSSCAGSFNWVSSCWGVSGVLLISHHYFSLLAQTKLVSGCFLHQSNEVLVPDWPVRHSVKLAWSPLSSPESLGGSATAVKISCLF